MRALLLAAICSLILIACAATNHVPVTDTAGLPGLLPGVGSLDGFRQSQAVVPAELDVTSPLAAANTTVTGGNLNFTPAAGGGGQAWALYAAELDDPRRVVLTATTRLWLLVADFGTGRWEPGPLPGVGTLSMDVTGLNDPLSEDGFVYVAVVCDPEFSGNLTALSVEHYIPEEWELSIRTTTAPAVELSWNSLPFDHYSVYRSTVADDPAPYLVGTVSETGSSNIFTDSMPEQPGGAWLPAVNDNGTPGDPADDFPALAPGIPHYYYVVPHNASGQAGPPSPTASVTYPWGERRTGRRPLPDTTSQTHVFADQLYPGSMTAAQVEWCADTLVGTQKIRYDQAQEFRAYNTAFIVVGYHLGLGAGDIGNVHGMEWDADADWPYVDRHPEWFHTLPGSTQPGGRVLQLDWDWYAADPDSQWADYLSAQLLAMLGENHCDGWFIDSCHELWNTDPAQWWEGPDNNAAMFGWWEPQVSALLEQVCTSAHAHPLAPYIIPNAGMAITNGHNLKYYGDGWACDGIMVENYGRWSPGSYYSAADWEMQCNFILEHQAAGLATILQCHVDPADIQDRMFQFGTYLLLRDEATFINWLGTGMDSKAGQWYPEWSVATGAPLEGAEEEVSELLADGVYRRHFGLLHVLVNPTDSAVEVPVMQPLEQLEVSGGGNIDADGNPQGAYNWVDAAAGTVVVPAHGALVLRPKVA